MHHSTLRASLYVVLAAIAAPLAGCQIAMSALRETAGMPAKSQAPAGATEEPAEPTQTATSDEPTEASGEPAAADEAPVEEDEGNDYVAAAPAPPRCTAPGRPGMCDGQCVDLQVNANYCGACFNHCHAGDHCDYGQCRDAEGKPN